MQQQSLISELILSKEQLYDMFQQILGVKKFEHQLLFNALMVSNRRECPFFSSSLHLEAVISDCFFSSIRQTNRRRQYAGNWMGECSASPKWKRYARYSINAYLCSRTLRQHGFSLVLTYEGVEGPSQIFLKIPKSELCLVRRNSQIQVRTEAWAFRTAVRAVLESHPKWSSLV